MCDCKLKENDTKHKCCHRHSLLPRVSGALRPAIGFVRARMLVCTHGSFLDLLCVCSGARMWARLAPHFGLACLLRTGSQSVPLLFLTGGFSSFSDSFSSRRRVPLDG